MKNLITIDKLENSAKPCIDPLTRKIAVNKLNEDIMEIVTNATSNEVKDVLLRVKTDENYDKNVKSLNYADANHLKDTVNFLRGLN